jgi:putative aminopeptidase FrvX
MKIDTKYLTDILVRLLNTPSPVGDTEKAIRLCADMLRELDLRGEITRKGVLAATWPGRAHDAPRAVTAHVDTLGAVVKEIKSNGRLRLAQLGTYFWTTIENEGVNIQTQSGASYRGAVLVENESHHVHPEGGEVETQRPDRKTVEVRIDARTTSAGETRALGIEVGDYVHMDPRLELADGFIRSRYVDGKACVACVFAAVKALRDAGHLPAQRATIHISNYEEVAHGGAMGFPPDIAELLAVDVAPIGKGQNADEYSCSLCIMDSDGPYDMAIGRRLRHLAATHDIPLRPDTYPEYCSDAEAFWKAGGDARIALIGPGVDCTHGYERTHMDALIATARLIAVYLHGDDTAA